MEEKKWEGWGGVYVIHNKINQKFYVGSTSNFVKRFILHRHLLRQNKHHSPHLQAAWNKYGEDAFSFMRLCVVEDDKLRLDIEQSYLDYLRPAYNVSPLAVSSKGTRRSEETRAKMREAERRPERIALASAMGKRPKSEEEKAKIAASHIGIRPTEETRAKLREASAKRWAKPEEREKIRQARLRARDKTV